MVTFAEARKAYTLATGFPTQSHGLEGPEFYIVVPLSPPFEVVYNDTVQIVGKDGTVGTAHYDRDVMGFWPRVEA